MGKEKFEKFTQNDWKQYIQDALNNDEAALTRALLIVYNNQLESEKISRRSILSDGKGFNRNDAAALSEAAELIENGQSVPCELWDYVRRKMPSYWRQIMEYSKENLKKQEERTPEEMNDKECAVELLRYPTDADWARCKLFALNTMGKKPKDDMTAFEWRRKILIAEHSPIRTLMFTIKMIVPSYVSVHFARHKVGVDHYVQSQRNDRQSNYDRNEAPQSALVSHVMDINAQALLHMSHLRLCSQADARTRFTMALICSKVEKQCHEFNGLLVPNCTYLGRCPEFKSCGREVDYGKLREAIEEAKN